MSGAPKCCPACLRGAEFVRVDSTGEAHFCAVCGHTWIALRRRVVAEHEGVALVEDAGVKGRRVPRFEVWLRPDADSYAFATGFRGRAIDRAAAEMGVTPGEVARAWALDILADDGNQVDRIAELIR